MHEFELIDILLEELGTATSNARVCVGPGDDCAITRIPRGHHLASSIDTLVADVHFPAQADAALIGYRAVMVSMSDLAAMGADPGFLTLALTRDQLEERWLRRFAQGVRTAAELLDVVVVGGNLARGPMNVCVSVHGFIPIGQALCRNGAKPGDKLYVTGPLGGAASALIDTVLDRCRLGEQLTPLAAAYWLPRARLEMGIALRNQASAAIDISDGLLQDLEHLCRSSGVGADLNSSRIPCLAGAGMQEALVGGDDYELCFSAAKVPEHLPESAFCIGEIVATPGLRIDNHPVNAYGYQHFR